MPSTVNVPLNPADLYHTGIVVADLDAAMRRFTALAGYQWTTPLTQTLPIRISTATIDVEVTLTYSLQSPHVELIAEVPGTPWTASPRGAVHHLGYFTDDLVAAARGLEQAGFTLEASPDIAGTHPALFAYYMDDCGTRIEIVDRAVIGDWPSFLRSLSPPGRDAIAEPS